MTMTSCLKTKFFLLILLLSTLTLCVMHTNIGDCSLALFAFPFKAIFMF